MVETKVFNDKVLSIHKIDLGSEGLSDLNRQLGITLLQLGFIIELLFRCGRPKHAEIFRGISVHFANVHNLISVEQLVKLIGIFSLPLFRFLRIGRR